MHYLLGLSACVPLVLSVVGKSWDWAWGDRPRSILPVPVDHGLTAVQAAVCVLFALTPAAGLYAVTALYTVMGVAVLWLRVRRGRADCGCWGRARSGRLGFGLGIADLALGALAYGATWAGGGTPAAAMRLFILVTMAILAFFAMVIVPVYRPVLRGYRERADRYRPWAMGFPDLEPAPSASDV
jgi:hypothetical protein